MRISLSNLPLVPETYNESYRGGAGRGGGGGGSHVMILRIPNVACLCMPLISTNVEFKKLPSSLSHVI